SGVWVLLVIGLMADMLRHLPSLTRMAVLCPLIAVPMLSTVIGLFRPDASWGLLTGCAAIALAVVDLGHVSVRRLVGLGLLVGLALISKPTGTPAAVAVMATAYVGAAMYAVLSRNGSR